MSFKGICSFCFSDVNNENADLITDTTNEILDVLLINLDLTDRSDHAICTICSERLLAAFEFKSTCKYTEATIIPYVDWEKPTQLDLWEIYLQERDIKQTVTLSGDDKVCRLCMKLTGKMYMPFKDMDKEEFQKFLPEINMNILKDAVVCKICFDSFTTHSNFLKELKNCIAKMRAIKGSVCSRNIDHSDEVLPIKMNEVDIKLEDKPLINTCIQPEQIKSETEECDPITIKTEFANDETSAKPLVSEIHSVPMESKGQTIQSETSRAEIENRIGCKSDDVTQKHFLKTKVFKCDLCRYITSKERKFKSHRLIHNVPPIVQMHKCDVCGYETKLKCYLKRHQLVHKDPSEVQMYKCDSCDFETKHRGDIKIHQLTHKDPSQLQMYRCDVCDFETKRKNTLKLHQLRHKDLSEVQTYNCDICDYKTKLKNSLQKHRIVHQDPSKLKQFTCDLCNFSSHRERSLKKHQLLHKDPSQVEMHKCDICPYEAKYKSLLKFHLLVHKDPSEVQMFSCDECEYQTKYRNSIKAHLLTHKDPSQVQMYKCDICNFETKFKNRLKRHQVTHKDFSEVPLYRCDICDYETKFKHYLKRHQVIHKDPSECQM